jgi:calcineurin-like phosphoesterase family protein
VTVFFTSDTHFGDPRVLRIDKRPFKTIPAHDEALIERWNAAVSAADEVWHLGDFTLETEPARIEALLGRLNGRKRLISGNNDGPATLAAAGWESVQAYAEVEVNGRNLVLCHYPFRTWHNMSRGWIDLHGHSHGRLAHKTRQYDVGVDVWDYRPVTLSTILNSRLHRWKSAS